MIINDNVIINYILIINDSKIIDHNIQYRPLYSLVFIFAFLQPLMYSPA